MIEIISIREATPAEKVKFENKQKEIEKKEDFNSHLIQALANTKDQKNRNKW